MRAVTPANAGANAGKGTTKWGVLSRFTPAFAGVTDGARLITKPEPPAAELL
jgi:hypothetical protein